LPSLLYANHMNLRPCTLEVGDYILTPNICIERKSLPDLIQSFKSGRLYVQAEAMCLHYRTPVLLIEFSQLRAFDAGLHGVGGVGSGGPNDLNDVGSKLTLLTLTFPKLRIIWSSSPAATAEIFADLKV
jgi:DNA excision repair protein ERCC-4